MDKISALKILVENSTILNEEAREELLRKLETMSGEDVEALGTLLAKEMEMNIEESEEFRNIVKRSQGPSVHGDSF